MGVTRSAGVLGLVAGILLIAGCSSNPRMSEGQKAIEGFTTLKVSLDKGQTRIDQTLASMNKLASGGDMSASLKAFRSDVSELKMAAADAQKRAEAMRNSADAYIAKWQDEMRSIENPSVRASLQQRREAVRSHFGRVQSTADAARHAYAPFIRDLDEIDKALTIDLSPAALPGLKPSMDKASEHGRTLKQRVADLQAELDQIAAGMGAAPTT